MGEEGVSLAETKRLGKDLLSSRANVNNAPLLLSILASNADAATPPSASSRPSSTSASSSSSPSSAAVTQCRLESLHSLHAFFVPLLRTGKFFAAARRKAKQELEAGGAAAEGDDGGDPKAAKAAAKAEAVYRLWVWNKYREFKKSLFRIVALSTNLQVLQIAAMNTLMDLVQEERVGEFNNSLYLKICARMVGSKGERNEILQVLSAKYFKYNDVRYFTYANIEKLVMKRLGTKQKEDELVSSDDDNNHEPVGASLHTFVRNIYDVLCQLPLPLKDDQKNGNDADEFWSNSRGGEESGKAASGTKQGKKTLMHKDTKKQKHIFSRAWLSFLQLSLPLDVYKKVLGRLHRNVVPYMTNPLLLSDFLTQSYNTGGLISVMALGSLFTLITKYGLEYPDFYNKLYALLEPSIFVARYRSRFFELLDTCLKSSHLPGYLGAAFAKRLGRLVLSAPPSGAIVVIALIHNLLRRHPSINVLVHRLDGKAASAVPKEDSQNDKGEGVPSFEEEQETEDVTTDERLGIEPFVATEADVAKCNALKSSLWEIESLRRHYCPAVSRFVESLENDLTVRAKTTEVAIPDFSATSYATIFEEEVGRRMKSVPMAFYSTVPNTLFPYRDNSCEGSFHSWTFDESAGLNSVPLDDIQGNEANDTSEELEEVSERVEDVQREDSMEDDDHFEELSSDGSGGSRSRSEQSDGEDWPQPLLKRLRAP
ncbi:unnamed protein product [Calypogeia fissa]